MKQYDYVVIGGGPGGYVSAIRAAQLGLRTALVEKDSVGGVCLNWGCIPAKSLLESAHFFRKTKSKKMGVTIGDVKIDMAAVVKRSRGISSRLVRGVEALFKKYEVDLYRGYGFIVNNTTIDIRESKADGNTIETLKTKSLCIATGASIAMIPGLPDSSRIITSKEALLLEEVPEKILIVGAGAIGIEFADYFQSVGSKVSIVEALDTVLPLEEKAISNIVKSSFEKRSVKIYTSTKLSKIEVDASGKLEAVLQRDSTVEKKDDIIETFDYVLVAVGVKANTEGFGFENTGGRVENGRIVADEYMQVEGAAAVYAIGDIVPGKQLAHKASVDGKIAAEVAAQKNPLTLKDHLVPSCVYCEPQVASVGYREQELIEKQIPFKVGEYPYHILGRALAAGENIGLSRVYFHESSGLILGAHLVGHGVSEMISVVSVAMSSDSVSAPNYFRKYS